MDRKKIDEQIDGWLNGYTFKKIDRWLDGQDTIEGWLDGWTNERQDGYKKQMYGWMGMIKRMMVGCIEKNRWMGGRKEG